MFKNYFDTNIAPILANSLSSKEIAQLSANVDKPCDFLETFIKPQAYQPQRDLHLCVSEVFNVVNRNHHHVSQMTDAHWPFATYFSNALAINDDIRPMDRVKVGPYFIATFEYDQPNIGFFKQQLAWFKGVRDHKKDSPFAKLDQTLAAMFSDYRGCCAVWSGHKSVHLHFAFTTDVLFTFQPSSTRDGFIGTWLKIEPIVSEHFGLEDHIQPDRSLRLPEQLRRIPAGVRHDLKASNIFGAPENTAMLQTVLFENVRQRSRGKASVFDIADFQRVPVATMKPTGTKTKTAVTISENTPEMTFCEAKMHEVFTSWPKFAGFSHHNGELVAHFANSEVDKNPASIMKADFNRVLIAGTPPADCYKPFPTLPRPLGEMIDQWVSEFHSKTINPSGRKRSVLEQTFADQATTKEAAVEAIATVINDLIVSDNQTNLLVAPEGISKSTSLFQNTPSLFKKLSVQNECFMYAFATYAMAQEKCDQFNAMWSNTKPFGQKHVGVLLHSFSRVYEQTCKDLNVKQIDLATALAMNEPSLSSAIKNHQPEVWQNIKAFYVGLRRKMMNANVVLFCVHDVAHEWLKDSQTRMMLAPAFWNESLDTKTRRVKAREATRVALLVHDEVSVDNLLLLAPAEHRDWIERMSLTKGEDGKKLWPSSGSATRLLAGFNAYRQIEPAPSGLTFEDAMAISEAKDFDTVTLANNHEYGQPDPSNEDIYYVEGRVWTIHTKKWPEQSAVRTLVLTTEALPTAIIQKLEGWTITELDCPLIEKSTVEVHASRSVVSKNLHKKVAEVRKDHEAKTGRTLFAIGNKIGHMVNSNTHHTAKGSNAYIAQDIVQTISPLPPQAVERLEAINAWLNIDLAIRLSHIDQFNQTAGRNLGFRATDPAPAHILLINSRVWTQLGPVLNHSRYAFNMVQSRHTKAGLKNQVQMLTQPLTSKERLARMRQAILAQQHKETA